MSIRLFSEACTAPSASPSARPALRRGFWAALVAAPLLCAAGGAWAQSADLVLANHVVTPDPVPAGGIATITMTVQNNGTGAASNVVLTDTIPAGSTFVDMSASDGGTCTASAPYHCDWASIPFPGSRTVTLRVRLPSAQVWTNAATVTSSTADPNQGNNSLSRTITVQQAADLAVTATSSAGGTIAAGTPYTYTLNVANNGPDPLPAGQSPTVTFNVPSGSSITSRPGGTGWDCQPASGYPLTDEPGPPVGAQITCTRSDGLANGSSFPPITVNAVGNVTGAVDATFDVSSNYLDGNTTNNTATVSQPLSAGTDMPIAASPGTRSWRDPNSPGCRMKAGRGEAGPACLGCPGAHWPVSLRALSGRAWVYLLVGEAGSSNSAITSLMPASSRMPACPTRGICEQAL